MKKGPFISDFPSETSIHRGFSIAFDYRRVCKCGDIQKGWALHDQNLSMALWSLCFVETWYMARGEQWATPFTLTWNLILVPSGNQAWLAKNSFI